MRPPFLLSSAFAFGLIFAGLTLAAPQANTWKLSSTLKASAEVPKPTGVKAGATGTFTGTAVQAKANGRATLTWKLTFAKLTGAAAAAHIHIGKPGKAGNVMVALCGPCKSGKKRNGEHHERAAEDDSSRERVRQPPHGDERRRRDSWAGEGGKAEDGRARHRRRRHAAAAGTTRRGIRIRS